jgi:hypothetical protein
MERVGLIEEFLEGLREDDVEDLPQTITTSNVNEKLLIPGVGKIRFLESATGWEDCSKELTEALLKLGATITFKAMIWAFNEEQLYILLEHGANPNMVKDGRALLEHVGARNVEMGFTLLDYGARLPPSIGNDSILFEYATEMQMGIASCRAALVALGAYCRRSKYHALRAWYLELAKAMWRMRGGGPGCGPRSRIWILEEDDDLN